MRLCSRSVAGVWAAGLFGFVGAKLGFDAVWNRPRSPQALRANDAHRAAAAKTRRKLLGPRWLADAATPLFTIILRPSNGKIAFQDRPGRADHLNLPDVSDLDPRSAALLDPASN